MRHVIMVGMLAPYGAPTDGAEVWVVNRAYKHQKTWDRLYFLDDLDAFDDEFIDDLAACEGEVYAQDHYPMIPNSEPYPLRGVLDEFGVNYFTSTTAFMLAHAIYEGVDKITLHQFLCNPHAHDYYDQKPCIDFWLGVAIGKGIAVDITGNSEILQPFPWQASIYGYEPARPFVKTLMAAGFERV